MDSKNKKGDFVVLLDTNAVSAAKISSISAKDNSASEIILNSSGKPRKRGKNSPLPDSVEKKDDSVLEVTVNNKASVYEFEESNGETSCNSKSQDVKSSDKKRGTDTMDKPGKKKTKHSR